MNKNINISGVSGDVIGVGVEGVGHTFGKNITVGTINNCSLTDFEKISTIDQLMAADSFMQRPGFQPAPSATNATQTLYQAGFQPIGNWHIQVMDPAGSTMDLDVRPDGTFQCFQQAMGLNIQAAGRWAFNPYNNMLQLQGLINGFQPFMLGIAIQGQQNNGYFGMGSDGFGYFLART